MLAVALDGRGLYGAYESTGVAPTDLDACGGHYGNVPAHSVGGVTYAAATNVYHYHTQTSAPFTLGCFGPVTSVNACKTLYSTCNTGYKTFYTTLGCYQNYDDDCPCFSQGGVKINQITPSIAASACSSAATVLTTGSLALALVAAAAVALNSL
jgi:hypothetical protein